GRRRGPCRAFAIPRGDRGDQARHARNRDRPVSGRWRRSVSFAPARPAGSVSGADRGAAGRGGMPLGRPCHALSAVRRHGGGQGAHRRRSFRCRCDAPRAGRRAARAEDCRRGRNDRADVRVGPVRGYPGRAGGRSGPAVAVAPRRPQRGPGSVARATCGPGRPAGRASR
ncbi:hypothetical protein OY671_010929, partial [Metschnikowia pulcherrima]